MAAPARTSGNVSIVLDEVGCSLVPPADAVESAKSEASQDSPTFARAVSAARIIVLLLLLAGAMGSAAEAHSAACGQICHGVAQWNVGDKYGAISYLRVGPFGAANNCYEKVMGTLWLSTTQGWIEQGYLYGTHTYEGGCYGLHWYWAEQNQFGYFEWYPWIGVEYNADYATKINWVGGGNYWLTLNGIWVAEARNQTAPAIGMSTGVEAHGGSYFNAYVKGHSLQKRAAGGDSWSYNWPGSFIYQTHAASAWWCIQYSCMEAQVLG